MASRRYQRGRYNEHPRKIQYIDGSAARQLDYYEYDYEEEYRRERRRPASRRVRKNREKARHWTMPYVIMLLSATLITMMISVQYLQLQSSITTHKRNITVMESSLSSLLSSNDAAEKMLDTNLDLNNIYQIATTELGMVYPDEDQVIQYDKSESEYVRQYDRIPTQD